MPGSPPHSELGYRGPSAKRQDYGSVEDMASDLYGRDESNRFFAGRWDEIEESNEQAQARAPKRGIKEDPYKIVVANALRAVMPKLAGTRFFLNEYLPGLNRSDTAYTPGGSQELMPKDMPQDGRLEHPEHFLHGGFSSVSGTSSGTMDAAVKGHDQGYVPNEDRSQYEAEKDRNRVMAAIDVKKKVASLLVKVGLAAPPAVAGDGYGDEFPNGPNDIHGTDQERVSRANMSQPRLTRAHNLPSPKPASKSMQKAGSVTSAASAGTGSSSSGGDSFTMETKPAKAQTDTKSTLSKALKGGKPRRSYNDASMMKPLTDGLQLDKVPKGFPEFDPAFPNAKVAALLKKVGF